MTYEPTGFSLDIFKARYAFTEDESWPQGSRRVATQAASAELPTKQGMWLDKFTAAIQDNLFVPGGRILANAGRLNASMINCFVLNPDKDSSEGWGRSAYDMIVTSMRGGGCGDSFTDVRPRGASIAGQRGVAPGAVELMRLIDACAQPVRNGGQRRVALMFSLDLDHPDIEEFLDAKLIKGQLTHANVSVSCHHTQAFIKAVKNDGDIELQWKGQYKRVVKARSLWNTIVTNAYNSAEPGFLNLELAEAESNIYYLEDLVTSNPCFHADTLVTTSAGVFPIHSLVGKTVYVCSNNKWVSVSNFRVTGRNQGLLKITLADGSSMRVTHKHSMILENGDRVNASSIVPGHRLKVSEVETHGNHRELGAYIKGFMIGDGCTSNGNPLLYLYEPKFSCKERLIESALQLPIINTKRSDAITTPGFDPGDFNSRDARRKMQGLVVRPDLIDWGSSYKQILPTEIFNWDKYSKLEFIAGYMDADGTASDTKNGFMYQVCSIYKEWLEGFQTLLKTIGVRSKLGLMKKAEFKDFGTRGGVYKTQDCWRLTISQVASVKLAKLVTFSRLTSFADKEVVYNLKPRFNKVVNVESAGLTTEVYCCTIPETHSFTLACGIETGQCGEILMTSYEPCCLGHVVLNRFVYKGEINYALLADTIRLGVRFLDNILTVNHFPLPAMATKSHSLRRIGLGTTALADTLALLGYHYGSEEGNKFVDKLFRFISKVAYEASIMLAIEKGPFPLCDPKQHVESGFMRRMPAKIKSLVLENGIRNCAILTQAPTGTVSILSGNCSAGIEPMFAPAYIRRYWVGEERKEQLVFHPLFAQFMREGKDVSHFVSARDLSVRDHLEVQRVVQHHIDNAVSKTINIAETTPMADVEAAWLEYLPSLKGTTFYRENTRGYVNKEGVVEPPPLVALTLDEAQQAFKQYDNTVEGTPFEDCPSGQCDVK